MVIRVAAIFVAALAGCGARHDVPNPDLGVKQADEPCLIGDASMDSTGTITANLVARSNGMVAHSQQIIAPSSPDYAMWLAHLDGMQPGQSKAIPCWQPESSDPP